MSFAVTPEEFILEYPNEYIYRIDFPSGSHNYISSPVQLEFGFSNYYNNELLNSGKAFYIKFQPIDVPHFYILKSAGNVIITTNTITYILPDAANLIGYDENIDIYKWNGNGFFLPTPSTFLRRITGPTREVLQVGFGIISVILLMRLLVVYYRRYMHRLI
jgi:hypothetical protein